MLSVSRPSGPKNEGTGQNAIMDQQRSRAAATPTTTKHAPPTPGQAAAPERLVSGCLYEAGFHTTGPHPQGGVALARTVLRDDVNHHALPRALTIAQPH